MTGELKDNSKERADKIRLELLALSDKELIWFSNAINSGEEIITQPFESVSDFVGRVSNKHLKSLPF